MNLQNKNTNININNSLYTYFILIFKFIWSIYLDYFSYFSEFNAHPIIKIIKISFVIVYVSPLIIFLFVVFKNLLIPILLIKLFFNINIDLFHIMHKNKKLFITIIGILVNLIILNKFVFLNLNRLIIEHLIIIS